MALRCRENFVAAGFAAFTLPLALSLVACAGDPDGGSELGESGDTVAESETAETAETTGENPPTCQSSAADALRVCVAAYSNATATCYADGDAPCASDEASLASALDAMEASIRDACEGETWGALDTDAMVGRFRNACASEASSLGWRVFGGPQGAVWPGADADGQSCLASAHQSAAAFVDTSLDGINNCLHEGDACDLDALAQSREELRASAQTEVESACDDLDDLIAVGPETFIDRAALQVDCLTATGHPETGGLDLHCGPSNADFEAIRGEWTQVVVDGSKWGTLCGDGSDYAFQVRLAPEGEPLDRLVIGLQGGGVCLFEEDCAPRLESNPGLFNAMDDEGFPVGIGSTSPDDSPFANYTIVYLPYCNQDVFAGGGVTETLGAMELPRYGAVNARSAVQMVRDVIWREMDEAGGAGFRPDDVTALFGGWSAGGYGTIYNYHWFLDDLQWPKTIAFPDAGLALDNGSLLGVSGLGDIKIPAWGTKPNLPPYCFEGSCAVGENLYNAISPRLKQVPEQQMLILSNPYDVTQRNDAFFNDDVSFINEMRASYCETKELPGINYYFTSVSDESLHVVTIRPELWEGEVDGVVMRDWFEMAVNDPDSVTDQAEEADFVTAFPGVEAYPCEVAP